jgi:chromosome segregation ATPase
MTSVQENKNELEAAVRYCESAITRAKQTIESMEFRQQAASKSWQEQTGREKALDDENIHLQKVVIDLETFVEELRDDKVRLNRKVEFLTKEYDGMKGYADKLLDENVEVGERNEELKAELDELSKAYKDSTHEEVTMKKAWREQRELVALRDDQIAMLERRLAKYTGEKTYPFKEGDLYYVFNQLDGTWVESVWDDESESMHDNTNVPSHPHKVYFTVDQKNVLDQFKTKDD